MILAQLYQKLRRQGVEFYFTFLYPQILKRRAHAIGKKDKIEVVFFAVNVAMWRCQGVYDLLSKDKRFNCHVVLTVTKAFTTEQQAKDLQQMREYFGSKGIDFVDFDEQEGVGYDVKGLIDPDILFYPQPYSYMNPWNHDFFQYTKKLLCYIPYGIHTVEGGNMSFDLPFHNLAWRIYYPFQIDKDNAAAVARNHAKNWVVSGYYMLDKYLSQDAVDVWKIKDRSIKRLIWAPHFSITPESTFLKMRSNFLWMSQLMLDVAQKYQGRLQIAFKPHPRLVHELYSHPDWGIEKTDRYYEQWAALENTQLETGDFVDLFKTSDAMIHDSGSFVSEYLFVNKPVAFVTNDFDKMRAEHSVIGRGCLDQHYIVGNEDEVINFIDDVVLGGQDSMQAQRTEFFETVLRPKVKGSTSQFIVDDIKKGLGIECS